jgi:hypothetical protein
VALPIVLGVILGALGFLPLRGALTAARKVTSTSNFSHASILLLAVVGSSIILFGSAVLCIVLSRSNVLPFVGGEVAGIVVCALGFGIWKAVSSGK